MHVHGDVHACMGMGMCLRDKRGLRIYFHSQRTTHKQLQCRLHAGNYVRDIQP